MDGWRTLFHFLKPACDTLGVDGLSRLAALERRARAQDDEITVLKAALADVLRRLTAAEEHGTGGRPGMLWKGIIMKKSLIKFGQTCSAKEQDEIFSTHLMLFNSTAGTRTQNPQILSQPPKPLSQNQALFCPLKQFFFFNIFTLLHLHRHLNNAKMIRNEENYVKMFVRGRPITMYLPSDLEGNYMLNNKVSLPQEKLKLEWVYPAYLTISMQCRSCLVRHSASVIIFLIAIHPDRITMATGQVAGVTKEGKPFSPNVRIWDSVTLNTLHIIGNGSFIRAVNCLSFSKANGGLHLMVVDDANERVMSIWNWQKEDKFLEIKVGVLGREFHPTDCNCIITCGKGHMYFWNTDGGMLTKKLGLFEKHEKPKALLCLTFNENGDAVTGDSSGNILVWGKATPPPGRGTNKISHVLQSAHDSGILSLCLLRDGTLVSGGGKDRHIVLWDAMYRHLKKLEVPEQYGPIRTLAEGKDGAILVGTTKNFILRCTLDGDVTSIIQGHTDELWGLASHPTQGRFLTCSYDRRVTLWEPHHTSTFVQESAQSADFHPSGSVVAMGMKKGKWTVLDAETSDLVTLHTDGTELLSVMRFSPDGSMLAIGSHENFIFLYSVMESGRRYARMGKCTGHSSFITHLDWASNGELLVSNSGDYEILYSDSIRDIDWATYTCVLGFHIYGVWPDSSDGTDINAVCRSHSRSAVAVADDFGKVQLFIYPCHHLKVPSRTYSGHSSHVTNVAFLSDDSYLISTGGIDMSIMQWKVFS
uniref:Uncharacterized protein n=1 Tax=Eptatretus burgeri TaxID=7764 RepID=A0A8C4RAU6_EPTBU